MKMTGQSFLSCVAVSWALRPSLVEAFSILSLSPRSRLCRSFSASSSSDVMSDAVKSGVSRLSTLQTLLTKHGAPGSKGCSSAGDLVPVSNLADTPELVSSLSGMDDFSLDLHPQLFPISKSSATGNYICALRRVFAVDAGVGPSEDDPWPIVESAVSSPGVRLLALNSEHYMRRIACENDGKDGEIIDLYNDGLGQGLIKDSGLDSPYEKGAVEALGYGVDKYVLLRVGPFPDLYESMAEQHAARGDEASSLIAAEASNGKFTGFGSTFLFYAKLLASLPNREEESKDAARVCLRLPLWTLGISKDELVEVATLGRLAEESDSADEAVAKLQIMHEKIRQREQEEDPTGGSGKSPEQIAIDEANYLMDTVSLTGGKWSNVRSKLAEIYDAAGRHDMAVFVDPKRE